MRKRLLREEKGFTLTEIMVTMVIMIMVLFALYSLFDMGLRVFRFGNDNVEAVENARLGLEKMDREIQAAYAYDKVLDTSTDTPDTDLFKPGDWTATRIKFGNDLDGDMKITCPNVNGDCEKITYEVYQPAGSSTYALGRANTDTGTSLEPVVEYVDYDSSTDTGLTLTYLKSDGATTASTESEIAIVRIALRTRVENSFRDGSQTLTTDVSLRNRSDQ